VKEASAQSENADPKARFLEQFRQPAAPRMAGLDGKQEDARELGGDHSFL
jgi:hypothetical protein